MFENIYSFFWDWVKPVVEFFFNTHILELKDTLLLVIHILFSPEVESTQLQYRSKETPQLIGQFSPNLVITNYMQCFLYGPIG